MFVCVWNCLIFFVGEYSSVWPEICWVLSQIQWRFFGGISGKTIPGEFFRNFVQTKAIRRPKLVKFRPNFCNFILGLYRAEKNSQEHFRMLFAHRQGGTSINESQNKIRGRKARTFCFQKTGFVHSRSGTYYASLLGYFGLKLLPDIRHCVYWVLARFEPQIRPKRLEINFLFLTARAERKVRLCVKLFDFFRRWILIRLTWNLSCFVPNSVEILGWNFRKKLFWENFSEILCKPRSSCTEACEIPA